jgi:glycogen phosphorylase
MGNPISTNVPTEQIDDAITELALDLRWSWNHATDDLWRELEPELWECTQNPWLILQSVSHEKLLKALADPRFRGKVQGLLQTKRKIEESTAWFRRAHPQVLLTGVVYFSMEYMLSEALPIYAGGLGNVAGDQLKSASDLNVPLIAIGLLYQQGYFRQEIDASGAQIARYPFNDPSQLPIRPLRHPSGDWIRLKLFLSGYTVWVRVWQVKIGRRCLYLLDTNDPANLPSHRTITSELYGGDSEMRLRQEVVLGVGGWRLVRELAIHPEVCHLNEGHSGFAVLERALAFMEEHNQSFAVALTATRPGNLFTSHTPIDAGFDRFSPDLMHRYFRSYAEEKLKIPFRDFMALGRANPDAEAEPFNMAYLAIRGSGAINGVSRLHGRVSRRLFQGLFPRWPQVEVPIGHVTNGVHIPTWDSAEADALWEKACGKERWRGALEYVAEQIRCLQDCEIWHLRTQVRKRLVDFVRKRLVLQLRAQGASREETASASSVFDEKWLTLGFARRFAAYKRPNMLLHDQQRLIRILTHNDRPVQIIVAGKAHPNDQIGQSLVKKWIEFVRLPEVRKHAAFLADHDMMMTQELVAGVDLWINTPRLQREACGTSGMKILANGGLNFSELDGWWAEAYAPDVGWTFGDGRDRADDPGWDASEANVLYSLLEGEIVPAFYNRDDDIPRGWVARIRESMARLTTNFSANRSIRQYAEEHYIRGAAAYCRRAVHGGQAAADLLAWEREIKERWHEVSFGTVEISSCNGNYFYRVKVLLGNIRPSEVQVEIYADPTDNDQPFRKAMVVAGESGDRPGDWLYIASVPANRPADHYTPRVIPRHDDLSIPLECSLIAWQK